MIHHVSKRITRKLIDRNIIDYAISEIYQYGLELMLSTILTSLSILAVACLMDSLWMGLLYFAVSMPLRATAGGYHASSYFRCFVVSNMVYALVSLASRLLTSFSIPYPLWILLLFCAACYILLNCPVRNSHHPVGEKVLKRNKFFTICFLCIDLVGIIFFYLRQRQSNLLNFAVITVLSVAILIIPTKKGGNAHEHISIEPAGKSG